MLERDPVALDAAARTLIEEAYPADQRLFHEEIPAALDAAAELLASVSAHAQADRLRRARAIMTRFGAELRSVDVEFTRPAQSIDAPVSQAAYSITTAVARATVRLEELVDAPNFHAYAPLVTEEEGEGEEVRLYKLMVARHAIERELAIGITAASFGPDVGTGNSNEGPTVEEISGRLFPIASGYGKSKDKGKEREKKEEEEDTFPYPFTYSGARNASSSSSSSSPDADAAAYFRDITSPTGGAVPILDPLPVPGDTAEETLRFFTALYDRSSMKHNTWLVHRALSDAVSIGVIGEGFKAYYPAVTDAAYRWFRYWLFKRRVEKSFAMRTDKNASAEAVQRTRDKWFNDSGLSALKAPLQDIRNTYLALIERADEEPGMDQLPADDPVRLYYHRKIADNALKQVLKMYPRFQEGVNELSSFDLASGVFKSMGAMLLFGMFDSVLPTNVVEAHFGKKLVRADWVKALLGLDPTIEFEERVKLEAQFGPPLINSTEDLEVVREFFGRIVNNATFGVTLAGNINAEAKYFFQEPSLAEATWTLAKDTTRVVTDTVGYTKVTPNERVPPAVTRFIAACGSNENAGTFLQNLVTRAQSTTPSYHELVNAFYGVAAEPSTFYGYLQTFFVSNRIEFYAAFGTAMNFAASYLFGSVFESLLGSAASPIWRILQVSFALFIAFRRDQLASMATRTLGLLTDAFEQLSDNQIARMFNDPRVRGFMTTDVQERLARRGASLPVLTATLVRSFLLRYPLMSLARTFTSRRYRWYIANLMEMVGTDPIEMAEDLRQYQGPLPLGGVNPIVRPFSRSLITGSEVSTLALFAIAPEGGVFLFETYRAFQAGVTHGWASLERGYNHLRWYMAFSAVMGTAAPIAHALFGVSGAVIGSSMGLLANNPAAVISGARVGYEIGTALAPTNPLQTLTGVIALVGLETYRPFSWMYTYYQYATLYPVPVGGATLAVAAAGAYMTYRASARREEAAERRREDERNRVQVDITTQNARFGFNLDRRTLAARTVDPAAATEGWLDKLSSLFTRMPTYLTIAVVFGMFFTRLYLVVFDGVTVRERQHRWPLSNTGQNALSVNEHATLKKRLLRRVPLTTPVGHY